jgi:hydroxymethylbilane synthase
VRIRIATRGSTLALAQAQLVADLLARRHPQHEFVLQPLTTHGDRHPTMSLVESPREGVFVKELERALLSGDAELAVHSAKDLPTAETPGLVLAAFPPRADARDVVISRSGATLMELAEGARVGTGSPRRAAQLMAVRADLKPQPIRGNVDTRLRRLHEGVVDALVLAAAGLERLGRIEEAREKLDFDLMLPAPGQGALAVQAVAGSEPAELARAIDEDATSRAVRAERALLSRLGGGCLSAVGAYGEVNDGQLELRAVVLDASGKSVIRASARGRDDARVVEDVAGALERQGASSLLRPEDRALAGMCVLVTRADGQAATLANGLRAEGASVVLCPVIEIEPIEVEAARLHALDAYDWLILTSVNGVDRLFGLLEAAELPFPTHIKVAAIGPETAARLRAHGLEPALVPERYVAEELADRLLDVVGSGSRVLLARAAGSREVLPERLTAGGVRVEVIETYRAIAPADLTTRLAETVPEADLITFTSSSTVRHFVDAGGLRYRKPSAMVACIGPITAQTAKELGVAVDIIAAEYTARGLVDAIVRFRTPVSP